VEEVAAYCRQRGSQVDPQAFVDYYTANGWMVGKTPMQDWQAAVRMWEKREPQFQSRTARPKGVSMAPGPKWEEPAPVLTPEEEARAAEREAKEMAWLQNMLAAMPPKPLKSAGG
jgi:hypothetical protein